jgi:hypothetical protein
MTLALSSSTLEDVWILNLALVDKVKVESSINYIDMTTQVAWTAVSNHLTYILRVSSRWMEMVALLTAHII